MRTRNSNHDRVHVYEMGEGGPAAELHVAVRSYIAPAHPGAGGVHHVAFRSPDKDYDAWAERLREMRIPNSGKVDRYWFRSLYFREPNGILFEIATDGPGFAVDEPLEKLGESWCCRRSWRRTQADRGRAEAAVTRLALARHEGLERGARFGRTQSGLEQFGFLVDARDDLVGRAAHQPARGQHALRRQSGDFARGLHRFRFDRLGGDDGVHQPGGFRLIGAERPAHHQQRERARMTHQPRRNQAGGRFRHQAEADEGRGKARVVGGDHMVAMHQHGGADADRVALHGGDERQLAARQRIKKAQDRGSERAACAAMLKKSPMSLPAQNPVGAPAISRQRSAGFCGALSMAAAMASYIAKVSAFFLSGRFIRTVRTGPSSVTMTHSVIRLTPLARC